MKSLARPAKQGQWSESALRVLRERYLDRTDPARPGHVAETPEDMCWRVTSAIAAAEATWGKTQEQIHEAASQFYELMVDGAFLPNSPTLMNAGKENGLQYSACFVLPVGDSMDEIFEAVKRAAIIHKCLVGDTMVMCGGLRRLDEVPVAALVMTDEGPFHVSDLHDNGEQSVFEVQTTHGYTVTGTAEHKLLVVTADGSYGWRPIGDIRRGEWLVLKPGGWVGGETKLPEFSFQPKLGRNSTSFRAVEYPLPKELTPELAELVGRYLGDGSNHRDGIRFTVGGASADLVERIQTLCLQVFGRAPSVSRYTDEDAFEVALLSSQVKAWWAALGFSKASSRQARIPAAILRSADEIASAFARGLFTADGCVRRNGHVTLATASERLGEELQALLLALGIPTRRRRDISAASYESWQISICSKEGFRLFRERIGFSSRSKTERLAGVDEDAIFVKGETIPNQRARLRAWYDALPAADRQEAKRRFDDLLNRVKTPRELSRQQVLAALAGSGPRPEFFEELARDGLFFVRATDVRPAGTRRVYDLTVPEKHAYLANGFVSHNSGGGTGFAFSRLRPKDTLVRSTGGKASGPVSFLRVFNGATEAVKQGGTRRGANMGILQVDHPDIVEFIGCKLDGGIANFNISVAITDAFMAALAADAEYDLVDPHTREVARRIRAKEVFDRVVDAAWRTGDPGLVFIERVNKSPANPVPELETIEATNPCGEQPLAPNDACNLGSINLAVFVKDDASAPIAWDALERTVRLAVRFLDDVIQVNPYPLEEILSEVSANRRIGLGVMGWADLLIQLGIPYDSEAALDMAGRVMEFITAIGRDESARLAEERGPFPNWPRSIYRDSRPVRNSTVTTIAPTGTISIIAGCSSGIEPLFAVAYSHIVGERHLTFVNPHFERIATARGFYTPELMEKVAEQGTLHDLTEVPEDVRRLFVTAHEVAPEWHVRMQAAFQKYTDNGVSKTINLPRSATVEDVGNAYRLAYDLGCLGITVFRDGCKGEGGQVLHMGTGGEKAVEAQAAGTPAPLEAAGAPIAVKPRPRTLRGVTYRVDTPLGTGYVHVNQGPTGEPFEVFLNVGKAGSDVQADAEALGRLISLVLRMPSPLTPRERVEEIVKQLDRIGGRRDAGMGPSRVRSIPDAIAQVLAEHVGLREPGVEHIREAREGRKATDMCPDCQNFTLVFEEGCQKCHVCGFSEC